MERDYKRVLALRKSISNKMIKDGYKEGKVYYLDGKGNIKYWRFILNKLTIMSALITEFFLNEFNNARLN